MKKAYLLIALLLASITSAAALYFKLTTNGSSSIPYRKVTRDQLVTLDPSQVRFRGNAQVVRAIYGQFVQLDESGKATPGHFSQWDSNSDYTEFKFKFSKNIYFSDGTLAELADVLASFRHLIHHDSTVKHIFADVAGLLESEKDKSIPRGIIATHEGLEFRLSKPNPKFPILLADSRVGLFSKNALSNPEKFFLNPIGAGAYKVVVWKPKTGYIKLIRNKYFLAPVTAVESFEISQLNNINDAIQKFEKHEIEDLEGYAVDHLNIVRKDIKLYSTSFQTFSLFFNPKLFQNIENRLALISVLDPDKLHQLCFPKITIATGNIPYSVLGGGIDQVAKIRSSIPMPTNATKTLKKLGRIPFIQLDDAAEDCTAKYISDLRIKSGIPIYYVRIANNEAKTRLETGNYDVFTEFLTIRDSEPLSMLSLAYGKSGINLTGESDAEYDALYEMAIACSERKTRNA